MNKKNKAKTYAHEHIAQELKKDKNITIDEAFAYIDVIFIKMNSNKVFLRAVVLIIVLVGLFSINGSTQSLGDGYKDVKWHIEDDGGDWTVIDAKNDSVITLYSYNAVRNLSKVLYYFDVKTKECNKIITFLENERDKVEFFRVLLADHYYAIDDNEMVWVSSEYNYIVFIRISNGEYFAELMYYKE